MISWCIYHEFNLISYKINNAFETEGVLDQHVWMTCIKNTIPMELYIETAVKVPVYVYHTKLRLVVVDVHA